MSAGTDALDRRYRKIVHPILFAELRERYIQLSLLWQDATYKTWHAYGHWPRAPHWDYFRNDGDALVTVMAGGATADEAVQNLLDSPRFTDAKYGTQSLFIIAAIEAERLAGAISHAA